MPHVRSPQADSDLDDIWYYIAAEKGNADIADRVIDGGLVQRFLLLANYPRIGRRVRPNFVSDQRSFPLGEFLVFYRLNEEDVIILHVLRGERSHRAGLRNC